MRYSHITPVDNFKLADNYNDMHLLLYHWGLQSKRYNNLCEKSKVYKIADNSQFELHKEIDYDDFLRWSVRVKADEIIAPDVMYDAKRTKELIDEFCPKVPKGMKIQGVVCGNSLKELHECYEWLINNEHINVVGLSKHGCRPPVEISATKLRRCTIDASKGHFESRQGFLSSLPSYLNTKNIHFLGVNKFEDYYTKGIRSIDGKYLAKIANFNKKIDLFTKIDSKRLQAVFDTFDSIICGYEEV